MLSVGKCRFYYTTIANFLAQAKNRHFYNFALNTKICSVADFLCLSPSPLIK